ncbi:MAG: Holliday junction branch migration protein RuvA [Porphyromonadaceae bacterium]|nr:Holliday junction branch migration protein RuvA [Porphyromonadaceae bacterium]
MITYLSGKFTELSPTNLIVECTGVGYLVHISLTSYTALTGKKEGKVLTAQIIREDAHLLYGFATDQERQLFLLLTSVSGIGPNTARVILSSYAPRELNTIITLGQTDALKAVKGIGLKTAQRIILELKGKLTIDEEDATLSPSLIAKGASTSQTEDEAISALKMLGYPESTTIKVVHKLLSDLGATATVETIIKQALKLL